VLDVIRVAAAAMVAAAHLTQSYFSKGLPDLTFLARASVAIFFVLSGFVIRYVTCRRRGTLEHYLKDRASRIYSVVIPALLVTLAADMTSAHVNPTFYANWSQDATHPISRIFENMIFTAQLWTRDVNPLSNSPFWSLNYEVAYYVLYGCAFYLTGWRRLFWIAATVVVVGPKILLLFPVWLIGCIAHDLYQRRSASGRLASNLNWGIAGMLAIAGGVGVAMRFDHGALDTALLLRSNMYEQSQRLKLGMTGSGLLFYAIGLVGCAFFLRVLLVARRFEIRPDTKMVRVIRFISEGTFPIYLLHFPLYVLIAACIPYNHASVAQKGLILLTILSLGIFAGHPCNVLKTKLRSLTLDRAKVETAA
jgi:peptidoglycan/LPS O-acetylase OafA/YrhL